MKASGSISEAETLIGLISWAAEALGARQVAATDSIAKAAQTLHLEPVRGNLARDIGLLRSQMGWNAMMLPDNEIPHNQMWHERHLGRDRDVGP